MKSGRHWIRTIAKNAEKYADSEVGDVESDVITCNSGLAEVIDSWELLPESVRRDILDIVRHSI
jgi:hypothetical protein